MLRREQGVTDKTTNSFADQYIQINRQPHHKVSNLSPYFTEIERRKKIRSNLQKSKKTIHESSSRSFRIKEKSVTSLQRELLSKGRQFFPKKVQVKQTIDNRKNKQRRTQSVNRTHDIQLSKTIQNQFSKERPSASSFLNELQAKVRINLESKEKEHEKEQKKQLRKGRFETLDQRARSEAGQLNMYKISYTNANIKPDCILSKQISEEQKKSDQPKRKNFRRNKYEAVSQDLERKQNNAEPNMNLEMDMIVARKNQAFNKARNRQLHGSVERSTQKYFNYQSYRPIRSKNDIQIYLSTVPNPPLHKASSSTNQQSDCCTKIKLVSSLQPQRQGNQFLEYDFDFKNQEETHNHLTEQNQELEESVPLPKQQDSFEKQRKKVQLEFFNRDHPKLDWSEDECKIDEI